MLKTTVVLVIEHNKPIPDLLNLVENRVYNLDLVEDCTATLDGWQPMSKYPTTFASVLMWNETANAVHKAKSYRIGHPVVENASDCTHWMPLPPPPEAA